MVQRGGDAYQKRQLKELEGGTDCAMPGSILSPVGLDECESMLLYSHVEPRY